MTRWQSHGLSSHWLVVCVCAHLCMHAIYKSLCLCVCMSACTSSVSHWGIRLLLIQDGHSINWDNLQSPIIITV